MDSFVRMLELVVEKIGVFVITGRQGKKGM